MSFQNFFFYLGKIAANLGLNTCKPKDFQTAKCLVKELADSSACISGVKTSATFSEVTLANGQTYTYISTGREIYVFCSVTSFNNDQSIRINGVQVETMTGDVVSVLDLCNGDVLTVVDPAAGGSGATWIGVNIPFLG